MEDESLKKKEKNIKLTVGSPNQICFSFYLGNEKRKKKKKKKIYIYIYIHYIWTKVKFVTKE